MFRAAAVQQRDWFSVRSSPLVQVLTRSFRLVFGQKSLRPYLWRPLAVSLAIYFLSVAITTVVLSAAFAAWLGPWGYMAGAAALIAALFFSGPIFLALSSLVSSFHWDPLGRKVEELCGAGTEFPGLTKGQMVVDTFLRIIAAVVIVVPAVIFAFTPLIWVGWILSGLLAFNDFTGVAYQRRGEIMPGTFFKALKQKGAFVLLLACIVLSALPVLMLLLHPVMACAGTLLVSGAKLNEPGLASSKGTKPRARQF